MTTSINNNYPIDFQHCSFLAVHQPLPELFPESKSESSLASIAGLLRLLLPCLPPFTPSIFTSVGSIVMRRMLPPPTKKINEKKLRVLTIILFREMRLRMDESTFTGVKKMLTV